MAVHILMSVNSCRSKSRNLRRSKRRKRTKKSMLKWTKHRGIVEAIRARLRANGLILLYGSSTEVPSQPPQLTQRPKALTSLPRIPRHAGG